MTSSHGDKPLRGSTHVSQSPINEGRFGRMFRRLPAAPSYTEPELTALAEQMHEIRPVPPGGWASSPTPEPDADNPAIPAAYTYLGQFIDHDITYDPNSSLQQQNDVEALHDFRTPRYDLDSLYGSGPDDEPFQYVPGTNPHRLLIEANVNGEVDLPRTSRGIAIIGDPRNDENTIVSQIHLTFLKLHNKVADQVEADTSVLPEQKFPETQRRVRWAYQQMIAFDYLPRIVGSTLMGRLLQRDPRTGEYDIKLRYYRAKTNAYMPIEFSAAAFRFGHSQVRGVYDLNDTVLGKPIFLPGDVAPTADLRGQRPLPSGWTIDWAHFVGLGANPQPSRLIDTHLVDGLFSLPGKGKSLPLLNLLRGQAMSLPSGQDVSALLDVEDPLTPEELGPATLQPTPLWFYVLKEAELRAGGSHLGPVGGRIVAEVLLGMLELDKLSWINVQPSWTPTIPVAGDHITLADILSFAHS